MSMSKSNWQSWETSNFLWKSLTASGICWFVIKQKEVIFEIWSCFSVVAVTLKQHSWLHVNCVFRLFCVPISTNCVSCRCPCRLMSSWCRALGSFSYWTACCLHWRKGDIRWHSTHSQKCNIISSEKRLVRTFEVTSSHVLLLLVQLFPGNVDLNRSQLIACTVTCC